MHAVFTDIFQLTKRSIRYSKILLVESGILSNYNYYRSMKNENNNVRELLAQARAIHFAMSHGQLTYEQAKLLVTPMLLKLNSAIGLIAKEHRVKPKFIRFQDLGRNL